MKPIFEGPAKTKGPLDDVPLFPDFAILGTDVNSRIPVTRIESWEELPGLLRQPFFKEHQADFIFRGQRRYDWALAPSLARYDNGIVREANYNKQIELFRQAVRARLNDYDLVDEEFINELWSVGQHHGLATPLIDWTLSPYVALFFAFESPDVRYETKDEANHARVIYALNKNYLLSEEYLESDTPHKIDIVQPKRDAYGRLVAQAGLFTVAPFENTTEACLLESLGSNTELDIDVESFNVEDRTTKTPADFIIKIYIPNTGRQECLQFLRQMNVHHGSLFPDIIGASNYCNFITQEYSIEQAEKIKSQQLIDGVNDVIDTVVPQLPVENPPVNPSQTDNDLAKLQAADESVIAYQEVLLKLASDSPRIEIETAAKSLAGLFELDPPLDWPNSEVKKTELQNRARRIILRRGISTEVLDSIVELADNRYIMKHYGF
ncbi:FRG domain-containing protein [Microvirga sp. STR05]|uniref:FRG domain-containing protein n=1 Tax=Hymenobacter duratus TaxID=2771356 RepID=A0ABR8JMS8_9BACT|nr:FRG domain-containing protein [Hymenobacter duratus]MBD2716710.1 FRG domain-containing protein [Hymenobacter duratus]MBR7951625.1 FRG domain-containing protein [Microvirga sp. STR05]